MLEQQHRPEQGMGAEQRHGQPFGAVRRHRRCQHPPQHRNGQQGEDQEHRQEVPGLQPHHPHHSHRGVGDIHGGDGSQGIDDGKDTQPGPAAAVQCGRLGGTQQGGNQQEHRPHQVQRLDGHVLPAKNTQLAQEKLVFAQGAPEGGHTAQRVGQQKGQLLPAVHRFPALPGNDGIVGPQHPGIGFGGHDHRPGTRQAAQAPPPAAAPGLPGAQRHQQKQHNPQQVQIRLGHIHIQAGRQVENCGFGGPVFPQQQGDHEIVAGQQGGVVAEGSPHEQGQRQQHDAQQDRTAAPGLPQGQPAKGGVSQQIAQPAAVQASQGAQSHQPGQGHAHSPGQEGQNQKAYSERVLEIAGLYGRAVRQGKSDGTIRQQTLQNGWKCCDSQCDKGNRKNNKTDR